MFFKYYITFFSFKMICKEIEVEIFYIIILFKEVNYNIHEG